MSAPRATSNAGFVALFCAALALAGCANVPLPTSEPGRSHPFPTLTHTTGTGAHVVHGIDVSKWQGPIDWAAARAGGVQFAFIKATEGGDLVDSRFRENWEGARRAGVPRGAYHFTFWCRPMQEQIEWFKRHVPNDPDALPPVLDVEWNFQSPTCPRRVPKAVALAKMREFLIALEQHTGKKPIIYADIKFHREILAEGEFAAYPFWVRSVRDLPQQRYPGRRWSFWQYTATGRVPGVNGPVDRNVFSGTQAQWNALISTGFRSMDGPRTNPPAMASAPTPAAQTAIAAAPAPAPAVPSQPATTQPPQTATALVSAPPTAPGVQAITEQTSAPAAAPVPAPRPIP